ncbi:MAG: hemolysin family protein [Myxococcota bacterium]
MIPATIIGVSGALACLAFQAFFSGSEMAMVSADRLKLQAKAESGQGGAALTLQLLAREDRLLGTCLIGTNLALVAGTTLVATLLQWWSIEVAFAAALVYTPFALIFGETLSKTVFQHHADRIAPVVAAPLRAAQLLFAPALLFVAAWSNALDQLLGRGEREPVRREEIVDLLGEGTSAEIDAEERRLIQQIFVMSETPVNEVMTPLVDLTAIPRAATVREATAITVDSGHSRLPVFQDRVDNIVGVVDVRALLFSSDGDAAVEDLMEPAVFVPELKRVDDLLTEMRHRRDPLVVVVDEYGGSVGIVTIEDLLEEVIGEIHDERDEDEPRLVKLSEREWRVPARTELDELAEETGLELPEGDFETAAGVVLSALGRIPRQGETVKVGELTFHIEEATDRAIVMMRMVGP